MGGYDNLIFGPSIPGERGSDGILKGDERMNTSEKIAKRIKIKPTKKRKRMASDAKEIET